MIKYREGLIRRGLIAILFVLVLLSIPIKSCYADTSYQINSLFPDTNFAGVISELLGKSVTSTVTQSELNSITNLNASNKNITSISGISHLINLKQIDFAHNNIDTIPGEISNLTGLNYVSFSYNKIIDLSLIENMSSSVNKNCGNQTINMTLSDVAVSDNLLRVALSGMFLNDGVTIETNNATITTDKSLYIPVTTRGSKNVNLRQNSGIGKDSILKITFNVYVPTPPKAPVIDSSLNNSYTNNQRLAIKGTAGAYEKITLVLDGIEYQNFTNADGNGNWISPVPILLTNGKHTISAKATNSFNLTSSNSSPLYFNVDTMAPNQPVIDSRFNNLVINTQTPTITGTGEPNTTIILNVDGSDLTNLGSVNSDGIWSYTFQNNLNDGAHTIFVRVRDAAGHISQSSGAVNIIIGSPLPSTPVITTPLLSTPVITAPTNNGVTNNQSLELSGTSDPNCSIKIMIDNVVQEDIVTADSIGRWTVKLKSNIRDGKHTITVKAVNGVGNESAVSQPIYIKVDNTPPGAPLIITPLTGANIENQKLEVIVIGEANATIIVYVDGKEVKKSDSDQRNGIYKIIIDSSLKSGTHTLSVAARDMAGNLSDRAPEKIIKITSKLPKKPIIKIPTNNHITRNIQPYILGIADPKVTVIVTVTNGKSTNKYTVKADGDGLWRLKTTKILKPSKYKITAIARNSDNRNSLSSNPINIKVIK